VETQLIELYLLICTFYDSQPILNQQRLSNFKPRFTDQELLTIYLFGHLQGFTNQRHIYRYFAAHWREWFPWLPTYQAFNRRLQLLLPAFELLIDDHLRAAAQCANLATADRLIDSLPVMRAQGTRANRARVARELADVGFCATKQRHYCGVKLHVVAARRLAKLPLPERLFLSPASQHDLAALREFNPQFADCSLFGDKAYADTETKATLQERRVYLVTPYKRKRNEAETAVPTLLNRFVSSIRQPIESLFGWLIQRTDLQNASRVRSTQGLMVHCYGKLAVACLLLTFYS
jgi:Transposase DDE domain.